MHEFSPSLETQRRYYEILQGHRESLLLAAREFRFKEVSEIAHKLEGSGGLYGFKVLSYWASHLFTQAQTQNKEETLHYALKVIEAIDHILINKA